MNMWPGATKNGTCADGWQRLAAIVGDSYNPDLSENDRKADGVKVMANTNAAQIAYGDDQPDLTGHLLSVGDEVTWTSRKAIQRIWFRNNAAGSNAVLIVTPLFNL